MSTADTTIDPKNIRCSDLEISDEALQTLVRMLVDAAIEKKNREE